MQWCSGGSDAVGQRCSGPVVLWGSVAVVQWGIRSVVEWGSVAVGQWGIRSVGQRGRGGSRNGLKRERGQWEWATRAQHGVRCHT